MQVLDAVAAWQLLTEFPIIRLAVFDHQRQATYAVPLAFVPQHDALQIVTNAQGRLATLLQKQHQGIGVQADEVRDDLTFRSISAQASVQVLRDSTPVLVALARRYGATWGHWRPTNPILAFELHLTRLQGRSTIRKPVPPSNV